MKRRTLIAGTLAAGASLAATTPLFAQTGAGTATPALEGEAMTDTAPQSGTASINGLDMYYEIHGSGGVPLVLVHGGFVTIGLWGSILTSLAETRQVVAVELEGHGHTPIMDRPLRYEQMADDVAGLIDHLGLGEADVLGHSLGGGVALQTAIRHPELVRKLVIVSAPFRSDGFYPEIMAAMGTISPEGMAQSPYYEPHIAVAPNPDDWPVFVEKMRHLLTEEPYDWTDDVAAIEAPTLLVFGDADSVLPEHINEFYQILGGGVPGDVAPLPNVQLAVLPGTAHSAMFGRGDLLVPIVTRFLDAPMPAAS